jgi:hypothetical protein
MRSKRISSDREHAQKAGRVAQNALLATDGAFHEGLLNTLARNRTQPGFQEHRVARLKEALAAKREATTKQILELDDAGRTRPEIATELGLSVTHIGAVLRRAGRKIPHAERGARISAGRRKPGMQAKQAAATAASWAPLSEAERRMRGARISEGESKARTDRISAGKRNITR